MGDFYQLPQDHRVTLLEQLARDLLPRWGINDAHLRLLKLRENAVFEVKMAGGKKYALRIHRAGYHSDHELYSELQWMVALQTAGVEAPQPINTKEGELFVVGEGDEYGGRRQADLFEWVDGEHLGTDEENSQINLRQNLHTLGQLAARIHNQATSWQAPGGFNRHAWDIDGLVGENPFWGRFWELETLSGSERQLMLVVRERLRQDLTAYSRRPGHHQLYSMIHADLVKENVMVNGNHLRVIDFDDAGYGWHLFELATTLYFDQGETHYELMKQSLIDGYRSVRPLSDEQLSYLSMFLLARGTTYLGWVHTRAESEEAGYAPEFIKRICLTADEYLCAS